MLEETQRVKSQTTAETHRYLEGFLIDSKGWKEELVHGVFANVGFWPEKLNINCSEGAFLKLCSGYARSVDNIQTRQYLIY